MDGNLMSYGNLLLDYQKLIFGVSEYFLERDLNYFHIFGFIVRFQLGHFQIDFIYLKINFSHFGSSFSKIISRYYKMHDTTCYLSHEVCPDDLVLASDNHVYSLKVIDKWLIQTGVSPVTWDPMLRYYLRPEYLIEAYIAKCQELNKKPKKFLTKKIDRRERWEEDKVVIEEEDGDSVEELKMKKFCWTM